MSGIGRLYGPPTQYSDSSGTPLGLGPIQAPRPLRLTTTGHPEPEAKSLS
jgi:hypothetical protein